MPVNDDEAVKILSLLGQKVNDGFTEFTGFDTYDDSDDELFERVFDYLNGIQPHFLESSFYEHRILLDEVRERLGNSGNVKCV